MAKTISVPLGQSARSFDLVSLDQPLFEQANPELLILLPLRFEAKASELRFCFGRLQAPPPGGRIVKRVRAHEQNPPPRQRRS